MNEQLIGNLFAEAQRQMTGSSSKEFSEKFAELIVRECIDKIETHQIPVGNSAAGEMACEWTYDALKEIRNAIKEHFGVQE
jgi:hypothetical protein